MNLSLEILKVLKDVRDHELGVMAAFDILTELVNEEMDNELAREKETIKTELK